MPVRRIERRPSAIRCSRCRADWTRRCMGRGAGPPQRPSWRGAASAVGSAGWGRPPLDLSGGKAQLSHTHVPGLRHPVPFSCMGRRTVSNVPAQALSLMNGSFVLQEGGAGPTMPWGRPPRLAKRVAALYLTAYSRPPPHRRTRLPRVPGRSRPAATRRRRRPPPWTDLCHVLVNVERVYLRAVGRDITTSYTTFYPSHYHVSAIQHASRPS